MDFNNLTISGRLTAAPEEKTHNDKTYAKFSIANEYRKDKTCFWNCVAWGKTGEIVTRYLSKGSAVIISGSVSYNEDKDKKRWYEINVTNLKMIGGKKQDGESKEIGTGASEEDTFS